MLKFLLLFGSFSQIIDDAQGGIDHFASGKRGDGRTADLPVPAERADGGLDEMPHPAEVAVAEVFAGDLVFDRC